MKFLWIGLFASASAAFAGTASLCDALPGNLVLNCGFEAVYVGSGIAPSSWNASNFTGFEIVTTAPVNVNSGDQSFRIANSLGQGAAVMTQTVVTIPGELYSFAFYLQNGLPNGLNQQFQAFWGTSANPTGGAPLLLDTGSTSSSYTQ